MGLFHRRICQVAQREADLGVVMVSRGVGLGLELEAGLGVGHKLEAELGMGHELEAELVQCLDKLLGSRFELAPSTSLQ